MQKGTNIVGIVNIVLGVLGIILCIVSLGLYAGSGANIGAGIVNIILSEED